MWSGLPVRYRRQQLEHMITLIDELYPTFRLFLFDEREAYAAPYTLFGPLRAAVYLGDVTWSSIPSSTFALSRPISTVSSASPAMVPIASRSGYPS